MVSRNNNLKIDYLYIVKSNTYKKMLKKNNNLIVSFIFFIFCRDRQYHLLPSFLCCRDVDFLAWIGQGVKFRLLDASHIS